MTHATHAASLPPMNPVARPKPVRTADHVLRGKRPGLPDSTPGSGRLVIVSNRVMRREDPKSGRLPMILRSVLRMHGGLWFGWSGSVTEHPALGTGHDSRDGFDSAAIDLDSSGHDALYSGFPARTLHPLLHSRLHDMQFDHAEMTAWFRVNARLAASLKTQLQPDDQVWINDIHLLPMARELRALGVTNRIGLFVHGALPACNVLASLPHHDQVFSGLACCDLVGVQTSQGHHALRDYLTGFHSATAGPGDQMHIGTHALRVSIFPSGIDVGRMATLAQRADARAFLHRFRRNLDTHKLLVGVDRPDPASGLCLRLLAIDRLLQQSPRLAGTFSMLQISPPTRYDMPRCHELDRELGRHVSDVNSRHAGPDWSPVRYLKKGYRQAVLAGYLRVADVGLMTPLHDGMTLAAKEYVACQDESDPGVLVLSRFAGAAEELADAVLVNPLDLGDMAAGIRTAMRMPLDERRARWESLMHALRRQDLRRWSNDFLQALAACRTIREGREEATRDMI